MTLFFDTKVQFLDGETISTIVVFHPNEPLFAVAGYGENRGGSVTIFDDSVRCSNFMIFLHLDAFFIIGRTSARHHLPEPPREPGHVAGVPPSKAAADFWMGEWRNSCVDQWQARVCADSRLGIS